jgi:hypothetical protein
MISHPPGVPIPPRSTPAPRVIHPAPASHSSQAGIASWLYPIYPTGG